MISLIAAFSKNKVIGKNGVIPWKLKNEKRRFKDLTMGNIVIMGRKTFEEIKKPLPHRITVVLSTTKNFEYKNCFTAKSLEKALEICKEKYSDKDIFISGGQALYKSALPIVEKMFITEIDTVIEGDTFFPEFNENDFIKTIDAKFNEELPYKYLTYTKKHKT